MNLLRNHPAQDHAIDAGKVFTEIRLEKILEPSLSQHGLHMLNASMSAKIDPASEGIRQETPLKDWCNDVA